MGASVFAALAALLVALFVWFRKPKASAASLPPGPKPVPILGNIRDLTTYELWMRAMQWAKDYGSVVYLHILGQGFIFLNTYEAASELMDRRGALYSDKPQSIMIGELCGCKDMIGFMPYCDQLKRHRRLFHKAFAAPVIPSYHPVIETETNLFLRNLVADPRGYATHARRYAGGLTLSVVYGYEAAPTEDPMLVMGEESLEILANRLAGRRIWLVDVLPILQYLPKWFPGAGFKRDAAIWKAKMLEFVEKPFEYVTKSMSLDNYRPSFCSKLLEDETLKASPDFEFDLKWSANSMYSASMDTTITIVAHFLLEMMRNPEILRKAQEEIDTVVGTDRLPTFDDRASLPYIEALMNEVLRISVPLPLSLPHRVTEDDVYNGMLIPKGTLCFANIWTMLRDENVFPDPYAFKPERYLVEVDSATRASMDPRHYVFGFGRRICPGANLIESSVWLLLAAMIATLNISKAVDDSGNVIEPEVIFDNAIFRCPNPFKCDIRPRSEAALGLIRLSAAA